MHRISFIQIPYDSGHFNKRMGAGPLALAKHGLAEKLRTQSDVDLIEVHLPETFHAEAAALVQLQHLGAAAGRDAIKRGARPIFLSGNCGTGALSAISAIGARDTGVVWFDAHGDCNTPDTSASGFLDGMCLAILAGRCWKRVAARFSNFAPVAGEQIIQIGVRHVDPEEQLLLKELHITEIRSDNLDALPAALDQLRKRTNQLYVHLDADVLDISEGAANAYACSGGITRAQLKDALRLVAATGSIRAASITSYDPACDGNGKIADALIEAGSILAS